MSLEWQDTMPTVAAKFAKDDKLDLDLFAVNVNAQLEAEVTAGFGSEFVRTPRLPLIGLERELVLAIIEKGLATRPTLSEYASLEALAQI